MHGQGWLAGGLMYEIAIERRRRNHPDRSEQRRFDHTSATWKKDDLGAVSIVLHLFACEHMLTL